MHKLGVFVGEDNWTFFHEIYSVLSARFETQVFNRRILNTPILNGRLNNWKSSRGMQRLLDKNDVCFFEWASDLLAVASYMPRQSKIITRLHSFELYKWAPRINWHSVDKVIVLSTAMHQMFSQLYPDQADKLIIIHNGCSLEKFNLVRHKEFTSTLGMLCAITPIKRIYEVILMLHQLAGREHSFKLRIAGDPDDDGRYAAAIHRLVAKLNLQDNVFFDGFVRDTASWLQTVDVFISNSYWEGQQTALIEALASGCYCLAHCWNGVDEMLPAENIYLSEVELMEKIIAFSKLPNSERNSMRAKMRSYAERLFDISATAENIVQLIEKEAD